MRKAQGLEVLKGLYCSGENDELPATHPLKELIGITYMPKMGVLLELAECFMERLQVTLACNTLALNFDAMPSVQVEQQYKGTALGEKGFY